MINETLLRMSLAHFRGQCLTGEVINQILFVASQEPDLSIDPARFAPTAYAGYEIAAERVRDIQPELHALHELHWLETEKHRHGLPLNPDYDLFLARERAGQALQFTVRRGGELVGNLRIWLDTSAHTQTPFAEEDTLFIAPAHRVEGARFLSVQLLRYAMRSILSLGVREFRATSKVINGADVLMRRLGFTHYGSQWVKLFSMQECEHVQ